MQAEAYQIARKTILLFSLRYFTPVLALDHTSFHNRPGKIIAKYFVHNVSNEMLSVHCDHSNTNTGENSLDGARVSA